MSSIERNRTSRRGFLRFALSTALAGYLSPHLRATVVPKRIRHLIVLYLDGGPSHIDTFDPKPGTRAGGPFKSISTQLEGVSFAEHLPLLAERARDLVVLRSVSSKEGSHERARFLLHTGFSPIPGTGFPSLGSTLSREIGDARAALPHYICLGGTGEASGLHGPDHEPFVVKRLKDGHITHVDPPAGVSPDQLVARLGLQARLNAGMGESVPTLSKKYQGVMDRAHRLMTTPLLAAFDHKREPERIQKAYGDSSFGRHCLVARRLVEAGVSTVEVELSGWDSHKDNFTTHAQLSKALDPAFARLVDDLKERNLFDSTLIVCGGEFGRSPSIGKNEGRDHHPACFSMVLAGGGLKGQVLGNSDKSGDKPVGAVVTIPDLLATVFSLAGVDPKKIYMAGDRPIQLGNNGRVLKEILGT